MEAYLKIVLKDENCFNAIAKAIFNKADADKSKFIDPQEFRKLMVDITAEYNLPTPTDEEIRTTMEKVDLDKNGTIEYDEFKEFVRALFTEVAYHNEKK